MAKDSDLINIGECVGNCDSATTDEDSNQIEEWKQIDNQSMQ